MMLIITEYIRKHELRHIARYISLEDIKQSVKKVESSAIEMSNLGYKNCKLFKIRISGRQAGRMILFLQIVKNYHIPVIVRLKKDKVFGQNLALNNKAAEKRIVNNLEMIFDDLKSGKYEKYEV